MHLQPTRESSKEFPEISLIWHCLNTCMNKGEDGLKLPNQQGIICLQIKVTKPKGIICLTKYNPMSAQH